MFNIWSVHLFVFTRVYSDILIQTITYQYFWLVILTIYPMATRWSCVTWIMTFSIFYCFFPSIFIKYTETHGRHQCHDTKGRAERLKIHCPSASQVLLWGHLYLEWRNEQKHYSGLHNHTMWVGDIIIRQGDHLFLTWSLCGQKQRLTLVGT